MGFRRASNIRLAIQIFGFIKHSTVRYNYCTVQNDIQKGEIWRLSHSTGCVIEYGESCCFDIKNTKLQNSLIFPHRK